MPPTGGVLHRAAPSLRRSSDDYGEFVLGAAAGRRPTRGEEGVEPGQDDLADAAAQVLVGRQQAGLDPARQSNP